MTTQKTIEDIAPNAIIECRYWAEKMSKAKSFTKYLIYEKKMRAYMESAHEIYSDYLDRHIRINPVHTNYPIKKIL